MPQGDDLQLGGGGGFGTRKSKRQTERSGYLSKMPVEEPKAGSYSPCYCELIQVSAMEFSAPANRCSVQIHPDRLGVSPVLCMALFVNEKFGCPL
jgi:hypothetical protein